MIQLNDVMVSIRMPRPMANQLKSSAEKNNFLDVSELVRSIVRKKWISYTNPELMEIKKLREGIELEIRKKSLAKVRQEVAKELEKIKSQLGKEGLYG